MRLFLDMPSVCGGLPPAFLFLIMLNHPLTGGGREDSPLYRLTLTSNSPEHVWASARPGSEPLWKARRH